MGFDLTGKSGNDFHANCWSWRPIHALCEELNNDLMLGLDLGGWGYNDGHGLHTEADCLALALAIRAHVAGGRREYVIVRADCDLRVGDDGRVLPKGTPGKSPWSTSAEHMLEFAQFHP